MEQALKGDKISHIYFIVRLILTCIGFVIIGFGLLVLGVNLSKTPAYATSINGELGQSLSGLSIVIGAIGFFIVVYCVIVFVIGVAYNLVPVLVGSAMQKKFLKTSNPKFIKDSLLLKCILLIFGIFRDFSLIGMMSEQEAFFILILVILVLIADIVILVFTAIGFSDACRAYKLYKNWQYANQCSQSRIDLTK